jgi:MFS transporter, DHA2 family, glioxin efflux transporter
LFSVFQTIGGSFFVSAGQSAFANHLLGTLPQNAPLVDPRKVILTGATAIRTSFPIAQVPGILLSYLDGIHLVFALSIGLAGLSFLPGLIALGGRIDLDRAFGIDTKSEEAAPDHSTSD